MMRPDDSSLSPGELLKVETSATSLLHRSDAWGTVPLPLDDVLAAAKLKVAPYSVFDPRSIKAYVAAKGTQVARTIKSAIGKIFGILDASEEIIHIDDSLTPGKQLFLTLHETGHFELPHQRKLFRFFEDSEQELEPSIADQFEREANNFARFVMFNGDAFKQRAADMPEHAGGVLSAEERDLIECYRGGDDHQQAQLRAMADVIVPYTPEPDFSSAA